MGVAEGADAVDDAGAEEEAAAELLEAGGAAALEELDPPSTPHPVRPAPQTMAMMTAAGIRQLLMLLHPVK